MIHTDTESVKHILSRKWYILILNNIYWFWIYYTDSGVIHTDIGMTLTDYVLIYTDSGAIHTDTGVTLTDYGVIYTDSGMVHTVAG